jgi:ABC-type multidrug transport system permease subunit
MKILQAVKKEFLEIVHDRTMLAVLIAFPIFIMMFMGSSFGSIEIKGLPIGVVGPTNTTFSSVLFSGLEESEAFNLQSYGSENDAMKAFRNGQLRAVIVVPGDFEQTLQRGNGSDIRIAVDNSDIALQQAVLVAMTSVVQASSTNITRSYVTSAWQDLYKLNSSASMLAADINTSRSQMESTKKALSETRQNMSSFEIQKLETALGNTSASVSKLQGFVSAQNSSGFMDESGGFLYNASFALNESIAAVDETHGKLAGQADELNDTIIALDSSVAALEVLKASTADNITAAALGINIASLKALRDNAQQQLNDTVEQIGKLETLNSTLQSFDISLQNYSLSLSDAKQNQSAALAEAGTGLSLMGTSLKEAGGSISQLKALLSGINTTTESISSTLDDALLQIDDVEQLIDTLQGTVAAQTGRDPETIAAPLSVKVESQYVRSSFVDFIIPQVIAVSLLFSCFLLASISLVREKTRKTITRLLMAPGALANVVAAKIASITLVSLGQVALIMLVAIMIFAVRLPQDIAALVLGTVISALVLSSIGILIGFYARTESAAIQTSLLIAIPMLFLGNIIFSPDLLPTYTQLLQQLLPLAHITNIFKVVLITSGDPAADVAALLSYFVLLALLIAFMVFRRRDIANYL